MIGTGRVEWLGVPFMRRWLLAGVIAAVAQSAQAADLPDLPILRGSFREPAVHRTIWEGFYVGGQAGYGVSNMTFSNYNHDLVDRLVANPVITQNGALPTWPQLESATHRNSVFGAFAGYNLQYENVVIGIDGSYMHGTFSGSASGENRLVSPSLLGNLIYADAASQAALKVSDFGSVRIRGGYTWGSFLPYLFAGVGLGRGETDRSVAATYSTRDTSGQILSGPITFPLRETTNQFLYGFTLGGGLDWMLFGGMFLRAEYEYLQFTSSINTNIHTVRAGLGYKF